ncbi:MAG TPA: amidase [Mycobacteriales bacterium]|nr:amidase [Mycobacteriales bacterium]
MTDLAWLDATAQADLVRRGDVTPLELVEAAIARIEALNPQLDAVIRTRFDLARAEAATAGDDKAGGASDGSPSRAPFRGVPILFKDLDCHVAGEPTAHGIGALHDVPRPADSHLAEQFRAAGFIELGRTNVPELGTTVTTEPKSFPPARNPWDPQHSTGGSSGGSAAAVASGMVAVAHANDGGGSIRVPASECGLVGLKPSRGRVSHGPQIGEAWAGGTMDGVVTRTVRDTAAILDAISTPMPGDPYLAPPLARPLAHEVGADPGRLRIGWCERPVGDYYLDDPECRAAVATAARLLEAAGHDVEPAWPQAMFERGFSRAFGAIVVADTARELREHEALLGRPVRDDELEPRNVGYRQAATRMSAVDYLEARAWLSAWARRMASWWTSYDVLVTPTVGGPAPELGWFTAEGPAREGARIGSFIPYTAQFNMTGQPAVSLPLHWSASGLPVGVQLVAGYGREDLLVRLAAQLESAAPWADKRPRVRASGDVGAT